MRLTNLFAFILLASPLGAQTMDEAPKPRLDRIEWILLASDAGARALDTYSTRWSLCNGNREKFLPPFVANHTANLIAVEGGMVALNYFATRNLNRRRHSKLAKLAIVADSIQVLPWAIRNLTMPRRRH
jgi:hypothetical protein